MLAVALLLITGALLVAEPDLGQTVLFVAVWGALFFLAGANTLIFAGLGGVGGGGALLRLLRVPARRRPHQPLPRSRQRRQLPDRDRDAVVSSAAAGPGTGPGEGIMKRVLPDSHTDFVFAVVGEEFGIILCLLIVALFSVLVMRGADAGAPPQQRLRADGDRRPRPRRSASRPSSTWA